MHRIISGLKHYIRLSLSPLRGGKTIFRAATKTLLLVLTMSCSPQTNLTKHVPAIPYSYETRNKTTYNDYEQLNLFSDVLYLIKENHVNPPEMDKLVKGAIRGLITELDPHSSYLTQEMYADFEIETAGEFCGLGIEISVRDHMITVVAPIDNTPAQRAGIKAGDKIIQIDGIFVKDKGITDAINMMRGEVGNNVTLTIVRPPSNQATNYTLQREIIHIDSIKSHLYQPGLAYIRISQFQKHTSTELGTALTVLRGRCSKSLNGLVLDLRNNPGGLLEEAVNVADIFLDSGVIVSTRGRQENDNFTYHASKSAPLTERNLPIVVLINNGSASAAEIVAGALQDHKRATVLGTQSFGKGSIQSVIELEDKSALHLTTAHYFTPSGASIQFRGITPDMVVEQPDVTVTTGNKKQQSGQKRSKTNATKKGTNDRQLSLALDLLRS